MWGWWQAPTVGPPAANCGNDLVKAESLLTKVSAPAATIFFIAFSYCILVEHQAQLFVVVF